MLHSGNISNYIDPLKTSVSEGKSLIAAAVTDKGVQTAADATFQTIATNIRNIATGYKITTEGWGYAMRSNVYALVLPSSVSGKSISFAFCIYMNPWSPYYPVWCYGGGWHYCIGRDMIYDLSYDSSTRMVYCDAAVWQANVSLSYCFIAYS